MHMKRWIALLLIAAVLLASGCTAARQDRLYLYGEFHANDELLQRELALWKGYYAGGMRDLFVELPYYTAQYLNRWMQADNDRILMEKAGSIADAAVQLSGVFQAAQEAADSYLKSIKAKEKELARLTKQAKKNMRD